MIGSSTVLLTKDPETGLQTQKSLCTKESLLQITVEFSAANSKRDKAVYVIRKLTPKKLRQLKTERFKRFRIGNCEPPSNNLAGALGLPDRILTLGFMIPWKYIHLLLLEWPFITEKESCVTSNGKLTNDVNDST